MFADDCPRWRGFHHHSLFPAVFVLPVLTCLLLLALTGCEISLGPASSPPGQSISEPVKVIRGANGATLVLAPVTIQGQGPFMFAVDTGASTSLIARSLAQRLGLQAAGGAEPISGIGGVTESIPVQVSNWSTGPIHLPAMTIASASIPHERSGGGLEGLLGSDIWSRFGSFTLDYSAGTLTVYKQVALAPYRHAAISSSFAAMW
jgi:hypothetical protein